MSERRISAAEKPDLSLYPEIPSGCCLNYNNKFNLFQVYRSVKITDPVTGKVRWSRETVGSIKNGKFEFGATYLLKKKNAELAANISGTGGSAEDKTRGCSTVSADAVEPRLPETADAVPQTFPDRHDPQQTEIPLADIVLGSLMNALAGGADCSSISNAIRGCSMYFRNELPQFEAEAVTPGTVCKLLMLVKPGKFRALYRKILAETEVLECIKSAVQGTPTSTDGNAGAAESSESGLRIMAPDTMASETAKLTEEPCGIYGTYRLMSFSGQAERLCLAHRLDAEPNGKAAADPEILSCLHIEGGIVTADVTRCRTWFIDALRDGYAHYCLCINGSQDRILEEVTKLFAAVPDDRMVRYAVPGKPDYSRASVSKVSVLSGGLLCAPLRHTLRDLAEGSVVRAEFECYDKISGMKTSEVRFYISSVPAAEQNARRIYEVIHRHWGHENVPQWALDMRFDAMRLQLMANDARAAANLRALNDLAFGFLNNYRLWLWNTGQEQELLSVRLAQKRCRDPAVAVECLAAGMRLK